MNRQQQEIPRYLFFGALTTLVSIGSFALFDVLFGINPLVANIFSWILSVLFAYITNRKWVFESARKRRADVLKEMTTFFAGRLLTLGIEELILLIFITGLGVNDVVVKILAQIVVLVGNYVISKWVVFRR